jgi:hypothetical protein
LVEEVSQSKLRLDEGLEGLSQGAGKVYVPALLSFLLPLAHGQQQGLVLMLEGVDAGAWGQVTSCP